MKFLHIADVHLGCRRYNIDERTKDFARAWIDVVRHHAVANRVDFVLVCGDFFNSRKVDPEAMNHAMAGLTLLRDAGIPVVAIEGNHDQHDAVTSHSWMRSLSAWGYFKLLEPQTSEGFNLVAWDEEGRAGSYVDIAGARIFGTHWFGTSTDTAIPLLCDALRRARGEGLFNILMLHTDVEGQLDRPNIPALSIARMKEMQGLVDYVALGHTHKRFEIDNWAFNPGSLEACSIDEYREERGVYLVEVGADKRLTATHLRDYRQRPFQRLNYDVSGVESPAAVHAGVMEVVRTEARAHDPATEDESRASIIEINLRGHLGFKNSDLDIARMRGETRELMNALHVMVTNRSVPVEYAVAADLDTEATRQVRERRILEDLITRDTRFRARAPRLAGLILEAKQAVLNDDPPERVLELIEHEIDAEAAAPDAPDAAAASEAELVATATALNALERNAVS